MAYSIVAATAAARHKAPDHGAAQHKAPANGTAPRRPPAHGAAQHKPSPNGNAPHKPTANWAPPCKPSPSGAAAHQLLPEPAAEPAPDARRIVLVVDCTGSRDETLAALQPALTEVIGILHLSCPATLQLGVLAYRDYGDKWVTRWSGWHADGEPLVAFIKQLRAAGGGNDPAEAAKTALKELITHCTGAGPQDGAASSAAAGGAGRTVVVWYTDAPPHTAAQGQDRFGNRNPILELKHFTEQGWPNDWLALCAEATAARLVVYPLLSDAFPHADTFFAALARATGGCLLELPPGRPATSHAFCAATVRLVLALMRFKGAFFGDSVLAARPPRGTAGLPLPDCEKALLKHPPALIRAPLQPDSLPYLIVGPELPPAVRFASDKAYRAEVYRVFATLSAQGMGSNPLFAGIWRAICTDYLDERRKAVLDKFSADAAKIQSDGERMAVKAFLDSSYDRSDEVQRLIAACAAPLPAIVATEATGGRLLPANDAMEIFRSCNAGSLRRLAAAVSLMMVRSTPLQPGEGQQRAVPLALRGRDFFAVLLHLVTPGLMLAPRASIMLALVAVYVRAAPLLDKALEYVREVRGRWIDWDLPENFSFGFVKFLMAAHDAAVAAGAAGGVLTPAEERLYRHLRAVGGLKINERSALNARLPFSGHKTPRPDVRVPCVRCGIARPFTLVDAEGVCGMCHWAVQERSILRAGGTLHHGHDAHSAPYSTLVSGLPDGRSYWCECRTCAVHYAVEAASLLHVPPKCHFCRCEGRPAPSVRCALCCNAFVCMLEMAPQAPVTPAAGAEAAAAVAAGRWVCPPCAAGEGGADEVVELTLREYLDQVDGPHFLKPLGLTSRGLFDRTMWDIGQPLADRLAMQAAAEADGTEAAAVPAAAQLQQEQGAAQLAFIGLKAVRNLAELRAKVRGWVDSGVSELGTCAMCFGDVRKDLLRPACGRHGCRTVACGECLGQWYGEPVRGRVLPLANLSCAFCKQRPAPQTLQQFNREVLALRVPPEALGDGAQAHYYAWCMACDTAKPAAARECRAAAPAMQEFMCEACRPPPPPPPPPPPAPVQHRRHPEPQGPLGPTRPCPKCGIMTEKVDGCNHVMCHCGAHFCYACGFRGIDARAVYDHMDRKHNGAWRF